MTEGQPPIRPQVRKVSVLLGAFAWVAMIVAVLLREPDSIQIAVAVVGFPVVFGLGLLLCWFMAHLAQIYGPLRYLGRDMRGLFVLRCNAVAILFPTAVLVAALLAVCGIPPVKK
jgi:hypothetical protein